VIADPSKVDDPTQKADELARVLVRGARPGTITRV